MTLRERVINALNHRESDRVPIVFGGVHDSIHRIGAKMLYDYYGSKDEPIDIQDMFQPIVYPGDFLLKRFCSDTLPLYSKNPTGYELNIKDVS